METARTDVKRQATAGLKSPATAAATLLNTLAAAAAMETARTDVKRQATAGLKSPATAAVVARRVVISVSTTAAGPVTLIASAISPTGAVATTVKVKVATAVVNTAAAAVVVVAMAA